MPNEWAFDHGSGQWRCHCGYASTSWDRFVAHFSDPDREPRGPVDWKALDEILRHARARNESTALKLTQWMSANRARGNV